MTSTLPPLVQAFAGGVGSVIANGGSYPLDVVVTRLQTQRSGSTKKPRKRQGAIEILQDIINKDGWKGLYAGFESDSAATLISNFTYFYAYSLLREILLDQKSSRETHIRSVSTFPKQKSSMLSVPEELGVGFVSGVISRAFSSPFSVITVRLQTLNGEAKPNGAGKSKANVHEEHDASSESENEDHEYGVRSVVKKIYDEEGLGGFWKGFHSTVPLCSNPAITLFLFQAFRRIFLRGRNQQNPTALQGFVGAAFSNSVAVALLYPLILLKTRIQTSRSTGRSRSVVAIMKAIIRRHGVQGLYQGLVAQILKGFFNHGLTMMTKQRIEQVAINVYVISHSMYTIE